MVGIRDAIVQQNNREKTLLEEIEYLKNKVANLEKLLLIEKGNKEPDTAPKRKLKIRR